MLHKVRTYRTGIGSASENKTSQALSKETFGKAKKPIEIFNVPISTLGTNVKIGIFKPVGFEYSFFVLTRDRGLAIKTVMNYFDYNLPGTTEYINTIYSIHSKIVAESQVVILKPLDVE